MALLYFTEERKKEKQWMGKSTVKAILAKRDERIEELELSARHRFVKMHEGYSRIEKLERQRKVLLLTLGGTWLLVFILLLNLILAHSPA